MKKNLASELGERAAESLAVADAARAAGLDHAARLDAAKGRTLKLEHARLAARFGPESPRARAAADRLAERGRLMRAALSRATTAYARRPAADPHAMIVHGHVTDKAGPREGLIVAAVDDCECVLARGETDAQGYYRLRIPAGGRDAAAAAAAKGAPAPKQEPRGTEGFLLVVLDGERTLYRDRRLVTPAAGVTLERPLSVPAR